MIATTVGSFPPLRRPSLNNEEMRPSIEQAIRYQQQAFQGKSVEWIYVSGQPQRDVVGIFAHGLHLSGSGNPYIVNEAISYRDPITIEELRTTAKVIGTKKPALKAHITGPILIAESCELGAKAPERYRDDPDPPRKLTLDLAEALAQEVEQIVNSELHIPYIQIDEPTLVYGADLELARTAIDIIVRPAPKDKIETLLHVCGDVGGIMDKLLDFPIDILSIELRYLNEIDWLDSRRLAESGKRLALGIIPVNQDEVPSVLSLERELFFASERYGAEHIWGITPSCGQRMSTLDQACERIERLAEVAERYQTLRS